MKGLSILGSTGSIGIQTLDIVRLHPDRFKVCALAAGSNIDLLEHQIREFHPALVSCASAQGAAELQKRLSDNDHRPTIVTDAEIPATAEGVDLVIGGLPGSAGLVPSFAAVRAGKDIALATKEVLVMAGDLFMRTAREMSVNVLPVDSEQSAIFQCLQGNGESEIRRILLTASGGPFRDMPVADMAEVTAAHALQHPRWKMGPKVTVDSATLMNKGLEVLEARWLFDLQSSQIEVVIHPQSIVHSMVEFMDGSILAQLGATDMRIPISYAMAYPERIASGTEPLSFPELRNLTFMQPDMGKFPLLKAAFDVLAKDDTAASIILNAADEVAVELFLAGRIPFLYIHRLVLDALDSIPSGKTGTLEEIIAFHEEVVDQVRDRWASFVQ